LPNSPKLGRREKPNRASSTPRFLGDKIIPPANVRDGTAIRGHARSGLKITDLHMYRYDGIEWLGRSESAEASGPRGSWKLSKSQKVDIGMLFLTGMSLRELAARYAISTVAVYRLLLRRGLLVPRQREAASETKVLLRVQYVPRRPRVGWRDKRRRGMLE
jgi:hypothetical protein